MHSGHSSSLMKLYIWTFVSRSHAVFLKAILYGTGVQNVLMIDIDLDTIIYSVHSSKLKLYGIDQRLPFIHPSIYIDTCKIYQTLGPVTDRYCE